MDQERTPFQAWLARLGDETVADLLQVKQRTVKSWRLGYRIPRPAKARVIAQHARITLADIYGGPLPAERQHIVSNKAR